MRWAWIGLAIVSTIGYLWLNPLIALEELPDGEDEDRAELEKGDEVEEEEEEELGEEEVLVDTGAKGDDATETWAAQGNTT